MEKDCYAAVRHAEIETQDILKMRKREEMAIALETSLFDAREAEAKARLQDQAEQSHAEVCRTLYCLVCSSSTTQFLSFACMLIICMTSSSQSKQEIDYLTPFLQSVRATGPELSREDAQVVRDMCLRNLKERLLERANIIQARLDKENAALAKRQAAFQRSQREHDQGTDEEFERFCSETMFRIQILEQRLAAHEETALHKYAELNQRVHDDPRLRLLIK